MSVQSSVIFNLRINKITSVFPSILKLKHTSAALVFVAHFDQQRFCWTQSTWCNGTENVKSWTAALPCSWCLMKVNKSTFFFRHLYKMADFRQGRFWQSKYKSGYGVICAKFNCSNYTGTTTNVSWYRFPVKDFSNNSAHLVVTKMH